MKSHYDAKGASLCEKVKSNSGSLDRCASAIYKVYEFICCQHKDENNVIHGDCVDVYHTKARRMKLYNERK